MMLTAFTASSQEDSTKVPLSFLQHVESGLRELDRRRQENIANNLVIAKYKSATQKLQEALNQEKLSNAALKVANKQVWDLYKIEQNIKPESNWFIWLLAVIASGGVGFVLGNVL